MSLKREHRLEAALLLRLKKDGKVRESQQWHDLIRRFETAGWICPSRRKDEWVICESGRIELEKRLEGIWPLWFPESTHLERLGLDPCKPRDLEHLPAAQRPTGLAYGELVNRRNWNASTGIGSKVTTRIAHVNAKRREPKLTRDALTRFRPSAGLHLVVAGHNIDLYKQASYLGECAIPERAWGRESKFCGKIPRAVITCENLGAYVDMPLPNWAMAVYSPGQDVEPALEVLDRMPKTTSWWHFGDLDPDGISIAERLASVSQRPLKLYIPSFASEYLEHARASKGIWGQIPDQAIFLVLKNRKIGIEQEVFMLDARLRTDLEEHLRASPLGGSRAD